MASTNAINGGIGLAPGRIVPNMFASKVTVVLGAQWGDEGKGKVVDMLATDVDVVCRCQVSQRKKETVGIREFDKKGFLAFGPLSVMVKGDKTIIFQKFKVTINRTLRWIFRIYVGLTVCGNHVWFG